MAGTLFVVATPIGNLEDITARAVRVLREVSVIAAEDTRRTAHLLARYGIGTRTTSLHEHNERAKSASLIARLEAGESIALVSDAGTPTVSDPGAVLVNEAVKRSIRVEPIPGPNAAMAALSVAGLASPGFLFLGFPPIRSSDRKLWLDQACSARYPVVFYEAPHRIRRTLTDILAKCGDRHAVIARELTKTFEELVRGPISRAIQYLAEPKGEFTVVLAEAEIDSSLNATTAVSSAELFREFGRLTDSGGVSRRQAISQLSNRYSLPARSVYSAIEDHKKSVG